jgi:hypothetical protein
MSKGDLMRKSGRNRPPRERREQQAAAPAADSPSLLARLWPTDQPIYKRPGAIIGGVLLAGLIGGALYYRSKKSAKSPGGERRSPEEPRALSVVA